MFKNGVRSVVYSVHLEKSLAFANMLQSSQRAVKYVYDLPYTERMDLCRILDQNDKWETLGGQHMNFDMLTIQSLRREARCGRSPTDELLTRWGHQNHTILELFIHLSKMEHYQAMMVIKKFIPTEYHRLIYEGEANLSRLFKRPTAPPRSDLAAGDSSANKTQLSMLNFNQSKSSNILPSKMDGVPATTDTESKILNVEATARSRTNSTRDDTPTTLVNNNNNLRNGNLAEPASTSNRRSPTFQGQPSRAKEKSEMSISVESVGLPMIPFKELEAATNGWDPTNILGKGGFGTVYKGLWKNTPVAVKRTRNPETDEHHSVQMQQILGELRMLNSYRHDNILPLYGFSIGGEDPCLIYQYMPNGSLEDRLFCRQGTPPLTWAQRLNIAVGTARGLQFLHTINEKPLIHGDIKSANILLDTNYKPKIGDFGLAREGPNSHYTHMKVSRVHGTRPYLPDEFLRAKKFSTKVDTHSFGIVLFELGTGLRAYDAQRVHKFLRDLIENCSDAQLSMLIDKKAGPEEAHTFNSLLELGKCCVSKKPKDRPEMVLVLQDLEAIAGQRDQMVRAQHLVQRNSLTPSTPYEMQLLHDHLSQQRNNNASPEMRNISPLPESNPFRVVNSNNSGQRASPRLAASTGSSYMPFVAPTGGTLPASPIPKHDSGGNQCVPNIMVTPTVSSGRHPQGDELCVPSPPISVKHVLPKTVTQLPDSSNRFNSPVEFQNQQKFHVNGGSFVPFTPLQQIPTTVPVAQPNTSNSSPKKMLPTVLPPHIQHSVTNERISPETFEDDVDEDGTSYFPSSQGLKEGTSTLPIEESQYSCILPLISELGIKKNGSTENSYGSSIPSQPSGSIIESAIRKNDNSLLSSQNDPLRLSNCGEAKGRSSERDPEDCRSANIQQEPCSTKNKPLWILGETG